MATEQREPEPRGSACRAAGDGGRAAGRRGHDQPCTGRRHQSPDRRTAWPRRSPPTPRRRPPPDKGLAQLVGVGPEAAADLGETRIPPAVEPYDETVTSERIVAVARPLLHLPARDGSACSARPEAPGAVPGRRGALSSGQGAYGLYQFDRREVLRYTRSDRLAAYRRVLGYGTPPVAAGLAAEHRLPPLFSHFINQVALFWRDKRISDVIRERAYDPSFGSIAIVRRAGLDLRNNLKFTSFGHLNVLRVEVMQLLDEAFRILDSDDIKQLFGADNAWDVDRGGAGPLLQRAAGDLAAAADGRRRPRGPALAGAAAHARRPARAQFEALLLEIAEYAEEWLTSAQSLGLARRAAVSSRRRCRPTGVGRAVPDRSRCTACGAVGAAATGGPGLSAGAPDDHRRALPRRAGATRLTAPWNTAAPLGRLPAPRTGAPASTGRSSSPPFAGDYAVANARWRGSSRAEPGRLDRLRAASTRQRDRGRVGRWSAGRCGEWGFRGVKVHRHDAPVTREVCEAARRVRRAAALRRGGRAATARAGGAASTREVDLHRPAPGQLRRRLARPPAAHRSARAAAERATPTPPGCAASTTWSQAVRRAGPDRLLFGSDGPWLHPGLELAQDPPAPAGRRTRRRRSSGEPQPSPPTAAGCRRCESLPSAMTGVRAGARERRARTDRHARRAGGACPHSLGQRRPRHGPDVRRCAERLAQQLCRIGMEHVRVVATGGHPLRLRRVVPPARPADGAGVRALRRPAGRPARRPGRPRPSSPPTGVSISTGAGPPTTRASSAPTWRRQRRGCGGPAGYR